MPSSAAAAASASATAYDSRQQHASNADFVKWLSSMPQTAANNKPGDENAHYLRQLIDTSTKGAFSFRFVVL